MSEPTTQQTMLKLATRVAKEAGIAYRGPSGTSRAMPPIDKDDLEDIKQVINDGIEMFIDDAPPSGWKWRKRILSVNISNLRITGTADSTSDTTVVDLTLADAYDTDDDLKGYYCYILTGTGAGSWAKITGYTALTGTVTVADWLDQYGNAGGTNPAEDSTFAITPYETVGGDIGRYYLPGYYCGEIAGKATFEKDSQHSQRTTWVPESEIRRLRQTGISAAPPYFLAIRQVEPQAGTLGPKRRFELTMYPDPSQADVIEFPYVVGFDKLDIEVGVADSTSTTTLVDATRDEADDYFNGWKIEIIDGTGRGSWALVTDYTCSTGTFTVADWLKPSGSADGADPAADSIYAITPLNNLHPAGIKFDRAIKSAIMYQASMTFDKVLDDYVNEYTQKTLPKAYATDARSLMHTRIGRKMPRAKFYTEVEKLS